MDDQNRESLGMVPFWFWNGDMDNNEIIRQIRECHEKGIRGLFIHPRVGLTVPYLSEEWFEKVKLAVAEARDNQMKIWIYDEYPYPSGIAGGEVILGHPEYEAKRLEHFCRDVEGNREIRMDLPWGEIISATAYPLQNGDVCWNRPIDLRKYIGIVRSEKIYQISGLTAYNRKRFFEGNSVKCLRCTLKEGRYRLYIFVQTVMNHMKFYGHFVDPLIPEAVDFFIRTTHEQYKKHVGNEFGRTILGFFSDEVGLPPQNEDFPWSPCLPGLFEKKFGYSLIPWLPALLEPMGDGTDRFRYDYRNLMTDQFVQSYDRRIQDWCHRNHLLYAAEKPVLRSSQLQYLDIPGCDTGHQKVYSIPDIMKARYRANPKLISSAAHFYRKNSALCECFHSIGWSMNLQDMKWIMDLLVACGINMLVPHAFFYTTDGLAKHDAPPSSFFQQPYWADMGRLSAYVRNLCGVMSDGKRRVPILLLDPVTSQWTAVAEKETLGKKLADDFLKLQTGLLKNHWDYYIVDSDILEQFEVQDGCLCRDGESFDALILPPVTNMEDRTARRIVKLTEAGARIIAAGCLPVEQIGETDAPELLASHFGLDPFRIFKQYTGTESPGHACADGWKNLCFVRNVEEVPHILSKYVSRDFSVMTEGRENPEILGVHYCKPEWDYYFFINPSGKPWVTQIRLKGREDSQLLQVSLTDGSMQPAATEGLPPDIWFPVTFAPFESRLYCIGKGRKAPMVGNIAGSLGELPEIRIDAAHDIWDLSITGDNALRLGSFDMAVTLDGDSIPCGKVDCEPVINQMMDGRVRLPIKTRDYFGCPHELVLPEMRCHYAASFFVDSGIAPLYLVMEPGSIGGEWQMSVNRHPIGPAQFARQPFYMPTNLSVNITPWIVDGRNEIELTVHTRKPDDGLVNPLYLFGRFGVFRTRINGLWRLTERSRQGTFADMAGCGLPFYAGERILTGRLKVSHPQDTVLLVENYKDDDSISIVVNGEPAGCCSWEPYRFPIAGKKLKAGENQLEFHIRSTLLGLFEGQRFDQGIHGYVDF